jgi:hypothetical protein
MYSLFALLFKRSYWQVVLGKHSWVQAYADLKRARKDRRARKRLRQFLVLLIVPAFCVLYTAWLVGIGAILIVPFILPVIWWLNRRNQQDSTPPSIAPPREERPSPSGEEIQRIRKHFAEQMLLLAVMVDRAGSEGFLKEKTIPEGMEVLSRRMHIDLLRKQNLWDRMPPEDREAVSIADGHWDRSMIHCVALEAEPLRLLRWILRLDFYLPAVGQCMRTDYTMASDLVKAPEDAFQGDKLIDLQTLNNGFDAAEQTFARCIAEGIHRGYYEPRDQEAAAWATGVVKRLGGDQHEDVVLGSVLVSEASEEEVRWATELASRRRSFLAWVRALLRGEQPLTEGFIVTSVYTAQVAASEPSGNEAQVDQIGNQGSSGGDDHAGDSALVHEEQKHQTGQ